MDLTKEINLAQNIIRGNLINFSTEENFINTSAIYRWTTENITSYFHHLINKKNILTVIGSGNQVLNSILAGSKNIDCFDISIFPKYYLYLHIASIITLNKEEYINFFLSEDRNEIFNYEIYDKISYNLKGKYKKFWDNLYDFNDEYDIYNSLLFRQDFYSLENIISNNPYLQADNYYKLKKILKYSNTTINTYECDISKSIFDKSYDLINLSNILFYKFNSINKIIEFLKNNFLLNENGKIINYYYKLDDNIVNEYIKLVNDNGYIENSKLLIYKN